MTVFDAHKNFSISTVVTAPVPALTGNTLQVAVGEGALFPAVPFNAVIFPANAAPAVNNAEIVRVTNRVGETFTIARAQEGTVARAVQVGDRIMNAITVKVITDLEQAVNNAGGAVVLAAQPVLETGVANQIRAGRVLTLADFATLLGLPTVPVGLFNLADLSNLGTGGALTNKGAVTFGAGIMGAATEAAIFTGSVAQALYIADTGAADPFRISYGSWGCWFRTAKAGSAGNLITKLNSAATSREFQFTTSGLAGGLVAEIAIATVAGGAGAWAADLVGSTVVSDDRWHFMGATYDGATLSLYVDGILEAQTIVAAGGPMNGSTGPLNIGGFGADGATAASGPWFGRVDEAFMTSDILSADQMRLLYAAKVAHAFGAVPLSAKVAVRRQRKGAPLTPAMFSTPPLHLYNYQGGVLTDQGSLGTALTNNNAALTAPGADGSRGNAFNFVAASTQNLSATDTGMPMGLAARTLGCWFKIDSTTATARALIGYGLANAVQFFVGAVLGTLSLDDGVSGTTGVRTVRDGQWHFGVVVIDNAAADGLKVKIYVDGKLDQTNTALASTGPRGANGFRIGVAADGASNPCSGEEDSTFVTDYAMGPDEIAKLYAAGAQSLGVSPKEAGAHVEAMDAASVYLIADVASGVNSQDLLDLEVAA